MPLRSTGIGAALTGFLLALVHFSPSFVSQRIIDEESNWLPQLESVGQTIVAYQYVSRGVAFLLAVGVILALGYRAGSRLALRDDYRRFLLTIGLGGLLGYAVGLAPVMVLASEGSWLMDNTAVTVTYLLTRSIGVALEFAVVGFAGAAFATFISGAGPDGGSAPSSGDSGIHAGSDD